MRAIVMGRAGGPEVLEVREVAAPIPAPGEVRVNVRAATLNRADLLQRRLPSIAAGRLWPVVDRTFPLERAAEAPAWMERKANFGKIVLTIDGD